MVRYDGLLNSFHSMSLSALYLGAGLFDRIVKLVNLMSHPPLQICTVLDVSVNYSRLLTPSFLEISIYY